MYENAYFSRWLPAMGCLCLFSFNYIIGENLYIIVVTISLINRKVEHLQLLNVDIIGSNDYYTFSFCEIPDHVFPFVLLVSWY